MTKEKHHRNKPYQNNNQGNLSLGASSYNALDRSSSILSGSLSHAEDENRFIIYCTFIDEDGKEGEWNKFSAKRFMKQINYHLTAPNLIDFLFSKIFNFDETSVKLKPAISIYQRFIMLERENIRLREQLDLLTTQPALIDLRQEETSLQEEDDQNAIDVAILFSDPLIELKRTKVPYQQSVSYQKEIQDLKNEFIATSREIKIKITNLTIDNLQKVCRHNKPTILHIICHGQKDSSGKYLHFESDNFSLLKVNPDDLRKILAPLEDNKPKLVFVNACNSAIVSDVFREAGVPFVVSVDQDHTIMDKFASNFSKNFYKNLILNGKSISDLFTNAQQITDKVMEGNRHYPCCCTHDHKLECKWFKSADNSNYHQDHQFYCSCWEKQKQIHHQNCQEAKQFISKFGITQQQARNLNFQQKNHIFTCCCYTKEELEQNGLLFHSESQKFKLSYDPNNDFFSQPLFIKKKIGKLIDLSECLHDKVELSPFVRKFEMHRVLEAFREQNKKCVIVIGNSRVGKSLFMIKLIEYMEQRALIELKLEPIQMKDVQFSEQIWGQMRKNSLEEFCNSIGNKRALLYLKDCDKILSSDATKFLAIITEITRRTNKLKIIITSTKEFASPFTQFPLKEYMIHDTRIYLDHLLCEETQTVRKNLINKFLENSKVVRTSSNIQHFAKYKTFKGIESGDEVDLDEIQNDQNAFKLLCMVSFFKNGLAENDFKLLSQANLISHEWVEILHLLIHKIEKKPAPTKICQNFNELVQANKLILTSKRVKITNANLREQINEIGKSKNFSSQIASLYHLAFLVHCLNKKTDTKPLRIVDFSVFSPNGEVFRDVFQKIKNPIEEIIDENLHPQMINQFGQITIYLGSVLEKSSLIHENLEKSQIELIIEILLSFLFSLISLLKLMITKNYFLKPLCYWAQRLFQNYLQLSSEMKLLNDEKVKKALIYISLLLLDTEVNDKSTCFNIISNLENIDFIIQQIQSTDFQKVIQSQLYQCKAYLYILKHQQIAIESGQCLNTSDKQDPERLSDRKTIEDYLELSNKLINNESQNFAENFVYQELNAWIRQKNAILRIELMLLLDPQSLSIEDTNCDLSKKLPNEKIYKNQQSVNDIMLIQIKFQVLKNQILLGNNEAFNSINKLIEQKFFLIKDEEYIFAENISKILKSMIRQHKDQCSKGLIYIMHSQPILDFFPDSNSFSSCNSEKSATTLKISSNKSPEQQQPIFNKQIPLNMEKQEYRFLSQPFYNIENYNDILRNQLFKKCHKPINYSFLSFNRRNYNTATCSGCQIMSIHSNMEEDSQLKGLQFEGTKFLEIDIINLESRRMVEKILQLQRVKILILCVNNSIAIRNLILDKIQSEQNQPIIISFPFKANCSQFDKILICQKFEIEFFKQYLNHNKSVKDSFEKAKEQMWNSVLKVFKFKKGQNSSFDKMFGDVPHLHSQFNSLLLSNPFPLESKQTPNDITPIIPSTNVVNTFNMDKTILKTNDIFQIKKYFNNPDVRIVNLYNQEENKVGKTTVALTFAQLHLERNLFFTGGIHFFENTHNYSTQSLNQSSSTCGNMNNNLSLQMTLENIDKNIFKQVKRQDQRPVLIILKGFDRFPKKIELLTDKRYFSNYRYLIISKAKQSLKDSLQNPSHSVQHHKVVNYSKVFQRLISDSRQEDFAIPLNNQHESSSSKTKRGTGAKQKNYITHSSTLSQSSNGQQISPMSSFTSDPSSKSLNPTSLTKQILQFLQKTTSFLVQNQQSRSIVRPSKSSSLDQTQVLSQSVSLNQSESLSKDEKKNFFEDIEKDMLQKLSEDENNDFTQKYSNSVDNFVEMNCANSKTNKTNDQVDISSFNNDEEQRKGSSQDEYKDGGDEEEEN